MKTNKPNNTVEERVSKLDYVHTEWGDCVHVEDVIELIKKERNEAQHTAREEEKRKIALELKDDAVECITSYPPCGDCSVCRIFASIAPTKTDKPTIMGGRMSGRTASIKQALHFKTDNQ